MYQDHKIMILTVLNREWIEFPTYAITKRMHVDTSIKKASSMLSKALVSS